MSPPHYIFKNGLRYVEPYMYDKYTTAKGPWVGKTILDVMSTLFIGRNIQYYKDLINSGGLTVTRSIYTQDPETSQKKRVKKVISGPSLFEEVLQSRDLVHNQVHRHEVPVADSPIRVIEETLDYLIIDKPAGIPVHPTQGHHYNTILEILKHENARLSEYECELQVCHRLDKLTSGVMILAKNKQTHRAFYDKISDKSSVFKEYVARVHGRFPKTLTRKERIVLVDPFKMYRRGGVQNPTPAKTEFELMSYNTELDQSIIKCKPYTGRKHQIRIHLRNSGFPIVNDSLVKRFGTG
ncbi:unnamed protein product [Ambrosiozyma monospora]|uniref:Unnamed protein product n=1 Tax=Ambrosiozyma monospora TaxID=43982 RepID=A0A9W7DIY1_AMBMO|nr:unnamed protein product [Ambrosiozyma monospora]